MKFLIVEDDDEVAGYIAKGLAEAGHVAERAADGREGLYRATGEALRGRKGLYAK